jgi:hypothetical protein
MDLDTGARQRRRDKNREKGEYYPELPRVSFYEAMGQASEMVARYNRMLFRTLRPLRDLRRYTPQVTIQSAGQVNFGGQQVSLSEG